VFHDIHITVDHLLEEEEVDDDDEDDEDEDEDYDEFQNNIHDVKAQKLAYKISKTMAFRKLDIPRPWPSVS
jgi:hypothetical protein